MAGRLEGRVAIVTGATSGIGERTAEQFVQEGARVVLTGRSEEKGRAIAARLGPQAIFCRTDVTREEDLKAMVECAQRAFGGLDILFNNAGFTTAGRTPEEITEEAFVYDMKLLVGSIMLGIKHALPLLKAHGGSVINNASIAGMRSGYGPPVYSAAKGAVIQLTQVYAMQLAPYRIRVNAISPGAIQTPIFGRALGLDEKKTGETLDRVGHALRNTGQVGRPGLPEDIAHAAVFLAGSESSFVTGHNLVVDGGAIIGRNLEDYRKVIEDLMAAGFGQHA